jgi:hypothetical protein
LSKRISKYSERKMKLKKGKSKRKEALRSLISKKRPRKHSKLINKTKIVIQLGHIICGLIYFPVMRFRLKVFRAVNSKIM